MTRESVGPSSSHNAHTDTRPEIDLLGLLWEEAPFPRLPRDAPSELKEYVQSIDNPRHVYIIHRASRRHNFQTLVEKFISQLRYGCDNPSCVTPSCFSCRKRLAGKAPVRRYSPSSARTLAVYLASQDNPERALCPHLRAAKEAASSTLNSLIISPVHPGPHGADSVFKGSNGHAAGSDRKDKRSPDATPDRSRPSSRQGRRGSTASQTEDHRPPSPKMPSFTIREQTMKQDHRSFAANMFGTVAFRMLEWLAPNSFDSLARRISEIPGQEPLQAETDTPGEMTAGSSPTSPKGQCKSHEEPIAAPPPSPTKATTDTEPCQPVLEQGPAPNRPSSTAKPGNSRRNSNAKVRASKPKRKLSTDPFVTAPAVEELVPTLTSPLLGSVHAEKLPRPPKASQAPSQMMPNAPPSPGSSDGVEAEQTGMREAELKPLLRRRTSQTQPSPVKEEQLQNQHGSRADAKDIEEETNLDQSNGQPTDDSPSPCMDDALLPQSLSQLNFEIVEFLFNVLREDQSFESPLLQPRGSSWQLQAPKMRRLSGPTPYPGSLKEEWRRFIEQSMFHVLSDPHALVRSFSKDGKLVDSRTLWRCMVRLIDAAPSLVFHSLWMAAASLFSVPRSLQTPRSPSTKSFAKSERTLSNKEAGYLMSICLHALVAAAPEVPDLGALYELSRLRSSGIVLAGHGASSRVSARLSLEYDDTFSNALTLRLARRIFSAIVARRYFADLAEFDKHVDDRAEDMNVLAPLLDQLDFLNSDAEVAHEAPIPQSLPLLLLDWARAVLLQDWNGRADFNPESVFGGALSLIETMYERRQVLLLADVNFRVEYLTERLDSANIPVDWLLFTPTQKSHHLLDRPFIFHPSTLVSYFRAINLSRMSRNYEEPSSIQERVRRFVKEGVFPHQYQIRVMEDMTKRATSKYLVLNIRRTSTVQDAFDQLWYREERELLRPLKVHLGEDSGEEGFDLGGVQLEFFKLAFADIFDASYGAFKVDDRTRMAWFVPGSIVEPWKFELIGLLFSVAVYNGLTIPVTLPLALYRRLLGQPVDEVHHIADGWPEYANGLTQLLEWNEMDGAVEDIFALEYQFTTNAFDQVIARDMLASRDEPWPAAATESGPAPSEGNPKNSPMVTNENRSAYVSDFIKYLTDVSIRPQYEAFERGFRTCLLPRSLDLLTPTILQSIVEGSQDIDLNELRRYTRYNGWDASHQTIRDFWSVVRRFDEGMKRKLLEFVTASDRVPVGGMKNVVFVIQKNGEEGPRGRLPTAYTCYGTLLLPEYTDKEVLKERLGMALENARGFGFQ